MRRILILMPFAALAAFAALYMSLAGEQPPVDADHHLECGGTALCITDRITAVVDGDTLYMRDHRIRLSLVDTPERNQPGFREAAAFTGRLCPVGSVATVDQDDGQPYDAYGRLVGKVTCSGKILNEELLVSGHARILTQYCASSEFSSELWAKSHGC